MKIIVKSLHGDEYILEVENDQLVSDLKARIGEKANGVAIDRLRLIYKGVTMHDANPVSNYNLEDGCKVHLIIRKEVSAVPSEAPSTPSSSNTTPTTTTKPCPMDTATIGDRVNANNLIATTATSSDSPQTDCNRVQSRFEVILRERLAQHFPPDSVEKIMANLQDEINADVNSSSLDDLERLAKQKLNISSE